MLTESLFVLIILNFLSLVFTMSDRKEQSEIKWSEWVEGILPISEANWFRRADTNLNTEFLPTKSSGIYEIAIKERNREKYIRLYLGRSKDVRNRIYSGYALNGSHLAPYLKEYLDAGLSIYFRWAAYTSDEAKGMETLLLNSVDYELNASRNAYRDRKKKVDANEATALDDEREGQIDELIEQLTDLSLSQDELNRVLKAAGLKPSVASKTD